MTEQRPSDGEMDLGDLPRAWEAYEKSYERVKALDRTAADPTALTARRFDESQTAGHRAYFAVVRYLGVARDNHDALRALFQHHGAGHAAPWSLLRPMFEAGFYATWILDPIDGRERRVRGLRCEVLDDREQTNYLEVFTAVPDLGTDVRRAIQKREADVGKTYRREADQLGVKWQAIRQKVNVVDELPKLRFLQAQSPFVRAIMVANWRMLSGLEHGLGYALLRGSDITGEVEIPGGQAVRLTINDGAFVTASKTCFWLLIEAQRRLERLHLSP